MPTQAQKDLFTWLSTELANREGISIEEAGERFAGLLVSDEVQDKIIADALALQAETDALKAEAVVLKERIENLERAPGDTVLLETVADHARRIAALEAVIVPT